MAISSASAVFAQTNLIQNPGFECSMRSANVWAGISGSGIINTSPKKPLFSELMEKSGNR
jgi:hypothetical protein